MDPESRMVLEDIPVRPDPVFLQVYRIWFRHIDEIALEPVRPVGPRQIAQRAIGGNTAFH